MNISKLGEYDIHITSTRLFSTFSREKPSAIQFHVYFLFSFRIIK